MSDQKELTAHNIVQDFLKSIKQSLKGIRVQTSKHLTKLEESIFKNNIQFTEEQDVNDLLLGDESEGYKGLCEISGLRIRQKKHSSFYAIKILYRLLTQGPSKQIFLQFFKDLEEEEFKLIKLDIHILNDNKNDYVAFKIAALISKYRPHLDILAYIESTKAQNIFNKWQQQNKNVFEEDLTILEQQQKVLQPKEIKFEDNDKTGQKRSYTPSELQENTRISERSNQQYNQRSLKLKQEKQFFEQIHIKNFNRNKNYYKNTLYDPLKIIMSERESENRKKKETQDNLPRRSYIRSRKSKIKHIFDTKIDKIDLKKYLEENSSYLDIIEIEENDDEESVEKKLNQLVDNVIDKVHVDSPQFDPYIFLTTMHKNTAGTDLKSALSVLEQNNLEQKEINKYMVVHFFEDFFLVEKGINKIQQEFIVQQKNPNGSFIQQYVIKLNEINSKVGKIQQNLGTKKDKYENLRSIQKFMRKYLFLLNIPNEIKRLYNSNDYKGIIKQYSEIKPYMKNFQHLPIFKKLFEDIQKIIIMTIKQIENEIQQNLNNYRKINELVSCLVDIGINPSQLQEQKQILNQNTDEEENNKIQQNQIQILIQQLSQFINQQIKLILLQEQEIQEEKSNSNSIIELDDEEIQPDPQEDLENDNQIQIKNKNKKQKITQEQKIILQQSLLQNLGHLEEDGDCLAQFSKNHQISLSMGNSEEIDIFQLYQLFKQLLPQIKNFYLICKSYENGEYNYKLQNKQSNKDRSLLKNTIFKQIYENLYDALQDILQKMVDQYEFNVTVANLNEFFPQTKQDIIIFSKLLKKIKNLNKQLGLHYHSDKFQILKNKIFQNFQQILMLQTEKQYFQDKQKFNLNNYRKNIFQVSYSNFIDTIQDTISQNISSLTILPTFKKISTQNLPQVSEFFFKIFEIAINEILKQELSMEEHLILISDLHLLSNQNQLQIICEDIFSENKIHKDLKKRVFLEIMQNKTQKMIQSQIINLRKNFKEKYSITIVEQLLQYLSFNKKQKEKENSQQNQNISNTQEQKQQENQKEEQQLQQNFQEEWNIIYNFSIYTQQNQNLEIRYGILDILTSLEDIFDQIIKFCPNLYDEIFRELILEIFTIFQQEKWFQPRKLNIVEAKQFSLEMEFIQVILQNYSTSQFQQCFADFQFKLCKMAGVQQIFQGEDILKLKKKTINNTKFKNSYNLFPFTYIK